MRNERGGSRGRRGSQGYRDRLVGTRSIRKRFLIVCEGAKTEPNYFKCFPVSTRPDVVQVTIIPGACESISLVEKAIDIRDKAKAVKDPYDDVWVVMDREDPDTLSANRFNQALDLADNENIKVAYSNEAFELWYLLHFCYVDSALSRRDYSERLSNFLGTKYLKNSISMYQDLLPRQPDAIRHARKLMTQYNPCNPEKDNPSTTVFTLVEELNNFLPGVW